MTFSKFSLIVSIILVPIAILITFFLFSPRLGMKLDYPQVRRDETVVDDYHGQKVADPYRWLEDPDSDETKKFVAEQNDVTMPYLEKCRYRGDIKDRLTELWDYPRYSCPFKRGSRYFYFMNTGLQNQNVLYVQDSLDGDSRVFLDPNTLSEDGTVALTVSAFSEDGRLFAYGLSEGGSDWITVKFKQVESGKDLPDTLKRVKFTSLSWTHDHNGVFYNVYPEVSEDEAKGTATGTNVNQKLYYHRIGQDGGQENDVKVAECLENEKWMIGGKVSDCGQFVVITVTDGCKPANKLFIADLKSIDFNITGLLPLIKVVDNFDAEYEYVTNEGTVFTFRTTKNAARGKLINIDIGNVDEETWVTLIPEHEKDVLEWATCVNNNTLAVCYMQDVKNVLHLNRLKDGSRIQNLPLPVGTISGYSGKKKQSEIFYLLVSFLTPGIIYHVDLSQENPHPKVFREIETKGFDREKFEIVQKFYTSEGGVKIPIYLVHRKGLAYTSDHPVLLYGYGGFNIPMMPSFSVSRVVFLAHLGGVVAVANIRGGGEYGLSWHKEGTLVNKQRGFSDFQAAAEWLAAEKYTSPKHIVINGGSNGGLLVAACLNQRPDLFGAGVTQVGVLDMLRFHKFTIGHAWTTDYGCADDETQFEWLIKYSPLHNVNGSCDNYPSLLLLTADHDDRVVPLHSFKFAAQIQHAAGRKDSQENPLLIRIDTKAGHGFGKPTTKTIEEMADIYAFIAENLQLEWIS